MPAHVLIPLDGSRFSEQALPYAVGLAQKAHAVVHLVKVHSVASPAPPYPETSMYFSPELENELRQGEVDYLEKIATTTSAQGVPVRWSLLDGPVVSALEVYVREAGIELIVMTTHGRGGLSRAWLGSVADSLVRSINVPVLLLRPRSDDAAEAIPFGLRHILIPVDGSELSEQVIEHARWLGRLTAARYTLMQVVAPPFAVPATDVIPVAPIAQPDVESLRAQAMAYLEVVANRLRADGLNVDTVVVVQTQSAPGILEEALTCGADLIALATHGRGGWQRVALGSVADKVLRGTTVPLLMLRPGALSAGPRRSLTAVSNEL
jgi:nucleotide-binding universal stress UspA family protein